jgi:hypothetical protein
MEKLIKYNSRIFVLFFVFFVASFSSFVRAQSDMHLDAVWEKRAAESWNRTLESYEPNPEKIVMHLNENIHRYCKLSNNLIQKLREHKNYSFYVELIILCLSKPQAQVFVG